MQASVPLIVASHIVKFRCRQCGTCCPRHQASEEVLPVDSVSYAKILELYRQHAELGNIEDWIGKNSAGELVVKFREHNCIHFDEGKCRIHRDFGGEYLPDSCKVYPRTVFFTSRGIEFALLLGCRAAAETLLLSEPIVGRKYDPRDFELTFPCPNVFDAVIRPELQPKTQKDYHYFFFEKLFIQMLQTSTLPLSLRLQYLCRLVFDLAGKAEDPNWPRTAENLLTSLARMQNDWQNIDTAAADSLLYKIVQTRLNTICHDYDIKLKEIASDLGLDSEPTFNLSDSARIAWQSTNGRNHEKIFENYLVNFILRKVFYRNDYRQVAGHMVLMYALIRLFCRKYAVAKGNQLTQDIIIRSIMEIEQGFVYSGQIVEEIRRTCFTGLSDQETLNILLAWVAE